MTRAPAIGCREKVSQVGKNFPLDAALARTKALFSKGTILASRRAVPGSTLVELAIAIAVIAVLAGIGFSSARGQISQFRLMQTARLLHSDIRTLRSMAIATNRQTRLVLVQADDDLNPDEAQQGEWLCQVGNRSSSSSVWDTLPLDEGGVNDDEQGTRSLAPGGRDEARGISLAPWAPLTGPGSGNASSIVFSPRGWVENPPGDFVDGYLVLEVVNKTVLDSGADQRARVRMSRGGMIRLETSERNTLASGAVGTAEASSP